MPALKLRGIESSAHPGVMEKQIRTVSGAAPIALMEAVETSRPQRERASDSVGETGRPFTATIVPFESATQTKRASCLPL